MSTFFPKSLWLWFHQCLNSKLLAQLLLDSSFLCKRLFNFIFHSLGWNYKIQTIRIYHTSTNLPVIRNLKIVHSKVRSTMQGSRKNWKSGGIICSPSWKRVNWSDTIWGGLISLPCPPNPTALQRSSKHDKGPSKFDDQVNELYNKTMKINLRMIQIIFVKFQVWFAEFETFLLFVNIVDVENGR